MPTREKFATVADYMAALPKETQTVLEKMREIVKKIVPEAEEVISYGIPTFKLNGKYVVYIAGFEKHVSMYPIFAEIDDLYPELKPYRTGKGTMQFPLKDPIPYDLVEKIVKFNLEKNLARTKK